MRAQDPQELFRFGQAFKALQLAGAESKYKDIKKYFVTIEDFLAENDYKISKKVFSITMKPVWDDLEKNPPDAKIGHALDRRLATEMSKLFPTIRAESDSQRLFAIVEKRYSTDKLLNDVGSLFAKDVFVDLDEIVQFDLRQACKCIVLECPTAAAFHLMRACESIVSALYRKLSGDAAVPGNGTWGEYEIKLKSLPNKPSDEYMEQSRHIRKNFRNPTQHPDKMYDIDEAQDLLNLAIDLINRTTKV
ncbi:hypothetical protein [Paracidovorax avenae]|uniref:hypothetical protein n=1 Tax=Paracidovorax avenae TaxID=80867 RepID=UPI000FE24DF1|nr:hypothetical protein [Paracidovorax avenae]